MGSCKTFSNRMKNASVFIILCTSTITHNYHRREEELKEDPEPSG